MTYTTYKVSRSGEQVVFEKTELPEGAKYIGESFVIDGEGIGCFIVEGMPNHVMGESFEANGEVYCKYPDNMMRPTAAEFIAEDDDDFMNLDSWFTRDIVYR